MKQMDKVDSIFINLETAETPQHIGMLGIYDPSTAENGKVGYEEVLLYFTDRLAEIPLFSSRVIQVPVGLDRPYRVADENFDLEFHIRHIALPAPGDWDQLCQQIARLHALPMDMKRPLWEIHVIEGLENVPDYPAGSFALYFKLHQVMVDSDLGQSVMATLHDREPYPVVRRQPVLGDRLRATSEELQSLSLGDIELLRQAVVNRMSGVLPFAKGFVRVSQDLAETMLRIYHRDLPAPQLGPKTRFDTPVGPQRAFEALTWPLEDFEMIAQATEASVKEIIASVVGGALNKYLSHHGELPEDSLVARLPADQLERLPVDGGHRLVASMVALGSDIADSVDRLYRVRDNIATAGLLLDTPLVDAYSLMNLIPSFLARPAARVYASQRLSRMVPVGGGVVVSNNPQLQHDLYCCGAKLVDIYSCGVLGRSVALFHAVNCIGGRIAVGITADREIMPDSAFYRRCLEESFADLKSALAERRPGETARKRRSQVKVLCS